ncbi:unnamed protein product [Linum tenue]|uniref:Uncharacterized protein n=1 Tax=Linum tenue TaxID=586396 RepID=A0AAV0P4T2_9ROSI|nr:unnamed protein product [Linum tenue]CAI0466183.1 unnamed protein product [Linum tenue]
MPYSTQKKSSRDKISSSRPNLGRRTPLSFDPSVVSTPRSSYRAVITSPALKSTARASNSNRQKIEEEKDKAAAGVLLKLGFVLILILASETVFSMWVTSALKPVFTADSVRAAGERSRVVKGGLSGRLMYVQNQLRNFAPGVRVSNCSFKDSAWKINHNGLLLSSHCMLYKSGTEEVKIWGWPLQTAGLIKTGISSRSFTVLSGRVTEWADGKIGYVIRRGNASWVQKQWSGSVVQLDPNTWVLEYGRSWIVADDKPRGVLSSLVAELVKIRVSSLLKTMNSVSIFEETYSSLFNGHGQMKKNFPT